MTTAMVKQEDGAGLVRREFNRDEIDLIKRTVAVGATEPPRSRGRFALLSKAGIAGRKRRCAAPISGVLTAICFMSRSG